MPAWWNRRRSERDFREEIEVHLALEAERQVAQRGLSDHEAHHASRRAFGNVLHAQERFYDTRPFAWAERTMQHLRYALRGLSHRPGFSIATICTLGVGIGFLTAIFNIFYAVAFRTLPVRNADRLVNVYQELQGPVTRNVHGVQSMVSYVEFLNYQAAIDSSRTRGGAITSATVYSPVDLASSTARAGSLHGEYVSCSYFATLGIRLALGRPFVPEDCTHYGAPAVVVLSHATWTNDFSADSTVIGRVVRLNQIPFTVIGVAEQGFDGLLFVASGAWVPVTMEPALDHGRDSIAVRDWSWMVMAGRLAPGADASAARARLSMAARQRDALYPGRQTQVVVTRGAMLNFPELRQQAALAAGLLATLGALVVVMVCANIMNLLLARGMARRREIGIRLALGASRGRLIEQLLTESLVLALLGGALGFALAYALPPLVPRLIPVSGLQINLTPDRSVLLFSLFVSVVTAVAFGLVPALQATGVDLVSSFKGGMIAGTRQIRSSRLRAFIVGTQVAGSALLLIVAALFIRGARRAATIDPGYVTQNVVSFGLNLPQLGYSPERSRAAYEALRDRIAAAPGVDAVAFASPLPLLGRRSDSIERENAGGTAASRLDDVAMASVSASYLNTLRITLLEGRVFTDPEVASALGGVEPVVVSQSLARLLSPNASAIGNRFKIGQQGFVVAGVVVDVKYISLARASTPMVYLPAHPERDTRLRIVARVRGSMASLERAVPRWAQEIDPAIVVDGERFSQRVDLELLPARLVSSIAGVMGGLTMLLALVGIYGVVSYAASQRTRDIAIRLALGASRRSVVRRVVREGSRAVFMGLLAGTALGLGISPVLRRFLLGLSPVDPLSYSVTAAVLLVFAFLAMYAPARRAARVDPARTLREE